MPSPAGGNPKSTANSQQDQCLFQTLLAAAFTVSGTAIQGRLNSWFNFETSFGKREDFRAAPKIGQHSVEILEQDYIPPRDESEGISSGVR